MADPLKVACTDCLAPVYVPCYSAYGDLVHADRQRLADLRALEQGTCDLCGQFMVRGSVEGMPVDAWHPDPVIAEACPDLPDPREDWNGYAEALQTGVKPGHPGVEHFVPDPPTPAEEPVMCPECRNGKHQNCGPALHPVTDMIVPCTCPDCGGGS